MSDLGNQYGIIVGDSDTLVFLGGEAQGSLRECSQFLSDISLHDNDDLDILIDEIVLNLEQFSAPPRKRFWNLSRKTYTHSKSGLIKQYKTILDFIVKATTALQIQEAQLIKDNEILKKLLPSVDRAIIELEQAIAYAKDLQCLTEMGTSTTVSDGTKTIDKIWLDRLDRRIQDMSVSHIVALRMKAQILLIRENNTKLIDKIIAAISGTIPLWQNQISLLLGIERDNKSTSIQDHISEISSKLMERNKSQMEMKGGTEDDIISKISSVNIPIQERLRELREMELNKKTLRKEMIEAIRM